MKKIIVFDLDGTLSESKQGLDPDMSSLLEQLLAIKKVAIISGGAMPQFQKQVINRLEFNKEKFKNLYLFPTKGAMMYSFDGENWKEIYKKILNQESKVKIKKAFEKVISEVNFLPKEHYGEVLEDRDAQITFSAFGQEAPVELKKNWDKDNLKKKELKDRLDKYLPEFSVEIGGSTSIDITQKTIDKAYAIEKICEYLNINGDEILFIGDAIFRGGNDYSVIKTAVDYIDVDDYNETKDLIKKILNNEIK